jgi:heme A synthase
MRRDKSIIVTVFLFVGLVLGALLYFLNPATTNFFPGCAFHEMTGLYCPGCGSTRAVHYLLHGELREALHYNALFVLVLPLLGAIFLVCAIRRRPSTTTPRWQWRWLALLVTVVVVFGVVRNIRRAPFSLLAPPAEAFGK